MINDQIRDKEVRLIGPEGEQIGVVTVIEAKKMADENDLDLVKISPNAKPPVCKIMDYSKYKFDQAKKAKEAKKKQKVVEIKEIRLSPNIDQHDIDTKLKQAIKFLKSGDKVKVTIRFRGRELGHSEFALKIMTKFAEDAAECSVVEKKPKIEARSMGMVLAPKSEQK